MDFFDFQINFGNGFESVDVPMNWEGIEIELSFENSEVMNVLNSTQLEFAFPTSKKINQWILLGNGNGGGGIFEGLPLKIIDTEFNQTIFDGYLNLASDTNEFRDDFVSAKLENYQMDMFNKLFGSVSFAYLATKTANGGASKNLLGQTSGNSEWQAKGAIIAKPDFQGGDYLVIPYQLSSVPDYLGAFIMGFSCYVLIMQLIDGIKSINGFIQEAISSIPNFFGFGIGQFIMATFQTVMCAIISLMIFKTFQMMLSYLVSPVLNKFAMRVSTLIQRACDYFGVTFRSTLINDFTNLCIMPEKRQWAYHQTFTQTLFTSANFSFGIGNLGGIFNGTAQTQSINGRMEFDDLYNWTNNQSNSDIAAYGYYNGTPKQLFEELGQVFNAKTKIIRKNGVTELHFDIEENFLTNPIYKNQNYILPSVSDQAPFNANGLFNNTNESQSKIKFNANELKANYRINYAEDGQDRNTIDFWDGNTCMAEFRAKTLLNENYSVLTDMLDVNLNFAMIKRKKENSFSEKAVQEFLPIVKAAIFPLGVVINMITVKLFELQIKINSANNLLNSFSNFFNFNWSDPVPNIPINSWLNFVAGLGFNLNNAGLIDFNTPFDFDFDFIKNNHALIENHTFETKKLFYVGTMQFYSPDTISDYKDRQSYIGWTIAEDNKTKLSAGKLMQNYYYTKLPKALTPQGLPYSNQWLKFENQTIPLTAKDFFSFLNYNQVDNSNGENCVITSCKWNKYKGTALVNYKIKKEYAKNLNANFIVDGRFQTTQINQIALTLEA